jgi:hypothetical protein
MERWIQTCRRELLDRTLIWNQSPLLHALREFETFYNEHRPHRTLEHAAVASREVVYGFALIRGFAPASGWCPHR